jgi:hypothetical protein
MNFTILQFTPTCRSLTREEEKAPPFLPAVVLFWVLVLLVPLFLHLKYGIRKTHVVSISECFRAPGASLSVLIFIEMTMGFFIGICAATWQLFVIGGVFSFFMLVIVMVNPEGAKERKVAPHLCGSDKSLPEKTTMEKVHLGFACCLFFIMFGFAISITVLVKMPQPLFTISIALTVMMGMISVEYFRVMFFKEPWGTWVSVCEWFFCFCFSLILLAIPADQVCLSPC